MGQHKEHNTIGALSQPVTVKLEVFAHYDILSFYQKIPQVTPSETKGKSAKFSSWKEHCLRN